MWEPTVRNVTGTRQLTMVLTFPFAFPLFPLLPLKSPSKWFWKLVPVSLPVLSLQGRNRGVVSCLSLHVIVVPAAQRWEFQVLDTDVKWKRKAAEVWTGSFTNDLKREQPFLTCRHSQAASN